MAPGNYKVCLALEDECNICWVVRCKKFHVFPCDILLWDYTHIYDVKEEMQTQFINEVAEKVENRKHPYQDNHVLYFDEVTVCENLVPKKSTGEVVGYCKLNEVQTELLELKTKLEHEAKNEKAQPIKAPPIAKKILPYMLKGCASDVLTTVAYFPVSSLSKEDLHQYTWDVIEHLEMSAIRVVACVCDGSSVNRGFIQIQQPHTKLDSGVVFDTDNPFDPSRRIFLIPDRRLLSKPTLLRFSPPCRSPAKPR